MVDDEDFILEVIQEFAGQDYAITTAANFVMADTLLRSNRFDLVLTDYSLGNGKTALDILKAIQTSPHPQTPAIVMTGEDPLGPVAMSCMKSGASDILVKPFPSRAYLLELMSAKIIVAKSVADS